MSPRLMTAAAGGATLFLGVTALLYPERVMGFLGFAVLNPSHAAAALGEVRGTYGGLFLMLGALTLQAALDPAAHRSRLVRLGLLWLGACGGRALGAYVDGNPGVLGWLAVGVDAALAILLLLAARAPGATLAPGEPAA